MPDEELQTVTEKYSQVPTHLWKLPQQPAGKLASYLDQLVEKTSMRFCSGARALR
jgi:hypothetical protein